MWPAPAKSRRPPAVGVASDAVLAAFVVLIVGLMVVPLPTALLDLLLSANMAVAVTLLMVALRARDPLQISSFPSLLLLSTLFRLALNVASTRLILLRGDAGEVIRAFGEFVVAGNHLVGAVIFLILTIIQFVVIAKGSERVAEVGARFTLDAMPGKQMAIDAELRAGSIDAGEARRRRRALGRESQFYGAMDGAMKFVKGDVIASMIVTVINLLGGALVGVFQRELTVAESFARYGILTIGDGLVSQIPSLVIATAAGILVTRVASEDPDSPLGAELGRQLFGEPRTLRMAAGFLALLGAIPGLPTLPFLALAAVLTGLSVVRRSSGSDRSAAHPGASRAEVAAPGPPAAWALVARGLSLGAEHQADLASLADDVRRSLLRSLGLALPPAGIRQEPSTEDGFAGLELELRGLPAARFPATAAGASAAGARRDDAPWLAEPSLRGEVAGALERHAGELFGITEAQALLDRLEETHAPLVRQVCPRPVGVGLLAEVLQRLLDERVPIRDPVTILEALAQAGVNERDPLPLTEFARSRLRRTITHRLLGADTGPPRGRELPVVGLSPDLEETVRQAVHRAPTGTVLALGPRAASDVIRAIDHAISAAPRPPAALLAAPDVRRFVRRLIELQHPSLPVIAASELLPDTQLVLVGRADVVG